MRQVTAISPGAVRTEFSNVRYGGDAAKVGTVDQVDRICSMSAIQLHSVETFAPDVQCICLRWRITPPLHMCRQMLSTRALYLSTGQM